MADDGARPRFSYIPGLDGIRGIWVVIGPLLYHAATDTVTGGILGIDLFFTLGDVPRFKGCLDAVFDMVREQHLGCLVERALSG